MCDSISDYRSIIVRDKSHHEDVENMINQLYNVKLYYLKSNILLSSLKEVVESEKCLAPETALKIKKAVLFGDLDDYFELSSGSRAFYESKIHTILGIPIELAIRNLSLTEEEKIRLGSLIENILYGKIKSVRKIFNFQSGEFESKEMERIKEIPNHLRTFVSMHKSTEIMFNFHNRFHSKIMKCYKELIRACEIHCTLVDLRVSKFSPCIQESLKVISKRDEVMLYVSRFINTSIKMDIFTPDTVKALKTIHESQQEEIDKKEFELQALRNEVSAYENLYPEGFEDLLEEYIAIEKALVDHRKTLNNLLQVSGN